MIGNRKFGAMAIGLLLLLAIILMIVMAKGGGDEQEKSLVQAELETETEAEIALEPEKNGADSEALHPDEVAAAEEHPAQSPPSRENPVAEIVETVRPEGTPEARVVIEPRTAPVSGIDGATVEQNGGDYSIMVGSFLQEINATARVNDLRNIGLRPVQETATIDGQEFYRVHLRGIQSSDEAEALGYFLNGKLGLDYLVLKR